MAPGQAPSSRNWHPSRKVHRLGVRAIVAEKSEGLLDIGFLTHHREKNLHAQSKLELAVGGPPHVPAEALREALILLGFQSEGDQVGLPCVEEKQVACQHRSNPREGVLDLLLDGHPARAALGQVDAGEADRAARMNPLLFEETATKAIRAKKYEFRLCDAVVPLVIMKRKDRTRSVCVALEDARAPVDTPADASAY